MNDELATLEQLLDGSLGWPQVHRLISGYKSESRFQHFRALLQSRVSWDEPIVVPLTPSLFIVDAGDAGIVKCRCGHVFCDWRENWKEAARIRVRRDPVELEELFGPLACDPHWMEVREFICPGCATLLEVEAAVPGYPFTRDFDPDIDAFYRHCLEESPPSWAVEEPKRTA